MEYEAWMEQAIAEAERAVELGEVPVGAVIIHEGEIIARACNVRESERNPLGHAELLAIRDASRYLGRWRLSGCTLVVTLEPCPMCAGALINARVDELVFGAFDRRAGAAGTIYNIVQDPRFNHRLEVVVGVQEERCRLLLQEFFADRRRK